MRSDRNLSQLKDQALPSLVDWDMRSDRNTIYTDDHLRKSLVDWDMRSDRNCRVCMSDKQRESSRLGYAL